MATDDLEPGCFSCGQQAAALSNSLPARDDIVRTGHWRVAHAFNSSLPGWLVLLPTRHITSFAELTPDGALELGGLVRTLTTALSEATGCIRTYLMQFSEAEGFSHLHLHLVPRMSDQPEEVRGPRIFAYLRDDQSEWVPEEQRDAIALALREALS